MKWALVDKQKLKFLPFEGDVTVDMIYTEHEPQHRRRKQLERKKRLGFAAVHDASFAGQPDYGSQAGFTI